MNPLLVGFGTKLVGRLIDKKQPISLTNGTTLAGFAGAVSSFQWLLCDDDPKMFLTGVLCLIISGAIALYK